MESAETYGSEEEVVVHARVSVPIVMALEWEADELGRVGTALPREASAFGAVQAR
jgi:hypothetical protein